MKKNLIIGVFSNYTDPAVVLPWVRSALEATDKNCHVVLIGINTNHDMAEYLYRMEETNPDRFYFFRDTEESFQGLTRVGMVHMLRFEYLTRFLRHFGSDYTMVITTDVRDVVFQRNPFPVLDAMMYRHGVSFVSSSECIRIGNENWNKSNIQKCFGDDVLDSIRDKEVLNVGILSGTVKNVLAMCSLVYQLSLNRKDWVADQAAYNYLVHTAGNLFGQSIYHSKLRDAYSLNAHVTSKPDQIHIFHPYLTDKLPKFDETDGQIKNNEGVPFAIVHQYDRVPEWAVHFGNLYGKP